MHNSFPSTLMKADNEKRGKEKKFRLKISILAVKKGWRVNMDSGVRKISFFLIRNKISFFSVTSSGWK